MTCGRHHVGRASLPVLEPGAGEELARKPKQVSKEAFSNEVINSTEITRLLLLIKTLMDVLPPSGGLPLRSYNYRLQGSRA